MSKRAFSLIEISIVILIIGILIAGVVQSTKLISYSRLKSAQTFTQSSPVPGIENLVAWYETTNEKSFVQINLDDQEAVAQWNDINPQKQINLDATQSASDMQPLFVKDCINGLPCLRFDGSNDVLNIPLDISYNKIPSMTIFGVFNNDLGLASHQTLIGQDNHDWDRDLFVQWPGGGGFSGGSGVNVIAGIDTILVTKFFSLTIQNGVSNGSKAYVNGSSTPVTFTENHTDSGGASITSIGALNDIATHPLSGNIAELIMYDRVLKDEERVAVEKYLSKKWHLDISE